MGAFRSSPKTSLYVEANEPPLHIRRIKLALQYTTKLMANEENPAYQDVFEPSYRALYDAKERAIKPLGLRIDEALDSVGFSPDMIAQIHVSRIPPWKCIVPTICFD